MSSFNNQRVISYKRHQLMKKKEVAEQCQIVSKWRCKDLSTNSKFPDFCQTSNLS